LKFPTDYKQSLNTILLQEVIKYNRLLRTMNESLKLVKLALIGRIGMSDELQDLANSLFDN
jgi:dynein heavy chain